MDNFLAIDQWNSLSVGSPTAQFDATSVGTTRLIPLELHFQHQSGDALVELLSEVVPDRPALHKKFLTDGCAHVFQFSRLLLSLTLSAFLSRCRARPNHWPAFPPRACTRPMRSRASPSLLSISQHCPRHRSRSRQAPHSQPLEHARRLDSLSPRATPSPTN